MVSIVVGISILVVVLGAIVYALIAMRSSDAPKKRMTPFGEISDENPEP